MTIPTSTPTLNATTFTWTAQNLIHYPLIEHLRLAPDGQRLLYSVRWPHIGDNGSEFRHTIYLANLHDDNLHGDPAPRALTGEASAAQPRWSPDGKQIAFLRPTPSTGKMGVWVMPVEGGEPWPVTGAANGIRNAVTSFQWSPDGKQIALLSVPWDAELDARRQRKDDTRQWRVDYAFVHLFVVDLCPAAGPLAPARALTCGRFHVEGFDWRPDGQQIALVHRPTPYIDSWPAARLATVSTQTPAGEITTLTDHGNIASWEGSLAYSPDGKWIACEAGDDDHQWPYANRIHLYPVDGSAPRILHDVYDEQPSLLGWSADSQQIYVQAEHGFSSAIYSLPANGSAPTLLYQPEALITATDVHADGKAVFVMENFTQPQGIYSADLAKGTPLQSVHQPTASRYPAGPLPQARVLHWRTPDNFEIEGVLYLPAGYDPQRDGTLPLLLHIHGGPSSIFQRQFAATPYYYTPAALCERGIAVLRCNPRGSGGYGRDFRYANLSDWGGGDFRDLMQGVDEVIAAGIADPQRLGIGGWSYGGFMTSWSITQTDRFVAASIGAPVTNVISFIGTADIPSFIPGYFGGEFWERSELMIERSPLFQAHKVNTPAIIQHGDADERVPLEQGLQYYMALERRGIPVQMYIYPRQGHAITEPNLLADAIQRNLEWFSAKLLTPSS